MAILYHCCIPINVGIELIDTLTTPDLVPERQDADSDLRSEVEKIAKNRLKIGKPILVKQMQEGEKCGVVPQGNCLFSGKAGLLLPYDIKEQQGQIVTASAREYHIIKSLLVIKHSDQVWQPLSLGFTYFVSFIALTLLFPGLRGFVSSFISSLISAFAAVATQRYYKRHLFNTRSVEAYRACSAEGRAMAMQYITAKSQTDPTAKNLVKFFERIPIKNTDGIN